MFINFEDLQVLGDLHTYQLSHGLSPLSVQIVDLRFEFRDLTAIYVKNGTENQILLSLTENQLPDQMDALGNVVVADCNVLAAEENLRIVGQKNVKTDGQENVIPAEQENLLTADQENVMIAEEENVLTADFWTADQDNALAADQENARTEETTVVVQQESGLGIE